MINPSLNFNKVFIEQVQKFLSCSFSIRTITTIKNCLMKKNKYVMALIMIYENNVKDRKTVYRVLCCVFNTLIDNYVCIDYLSCQSKTLCDISSNPTFKDTRFLVETIDSQYKHNCI